MCVCVRTYVCVCLHMCVHACVCAVQECYCVRHIWKVESISPSRSSMREDSTSLAGQIPLTESGKRN